MHMYTYTHGWAHQLTENVHENAKMVFPVFGKIREAEHFRGVPSSQPASHPASQTASQPASQPGRQPASHPASQAGSQPASHPRDGLDNMWVCICTTALFRV